MLFGHCCLPQRKFSSDASIAEVFGANMQIQEQELLATDVGQERGRQVCDGEGQGLAHSFGCSQCVSKESWGGHGAPYAC